MARRKLIDIVMKESIEKSFSYFLLSSSRLVISNNSTKDKQLFTCKIPQHLCRRNNASDHGLFFSCAGAMALFDELSTYHVMLADKTARPGVSIQLSTEIFSKCEANKEVVLTTRIDKIGKYIGFCSMEIHDSGGELVARGRHLKFMVMGTMWDFLMSSAVLPFTMSLYFFFTSHSLGLLLTRTFARGLLVKVDTPLRQRVVDGHPQPVHDASDLLSVRPVTGQPDLVLTGEGAAVFEWDSRGVDSRNALGAAHGGAIAMAIESACIQAAQSGESNEIFRELEINYLAAPKGEVCILVEVQRRSDGSAKGATGKVISKRTQQIYTDFKGKWG